MSLAKSATAAAFAAMVLAFMFNGCGQHSFDDVFEEGSSSSEVGNSGGASSSGSGGGVFYDTIVVNTQTWLKYNLNIPHNSGNGNSWCYEGYDALYGDYLSGSKGCDRYGRLYDWAAAMNLPSECNSKSCKNQIQSPHQGLCPEGFHVPTREQWKTLYNIDNSLKSILPLPGGERDDEGNFSEAGKEGFWWSAAYASQINLSDDKAHSQKLTHNSNWSGEEFLSKSYGHSLRCVQEDISAISSSSSRPSSSSSSISSSGSSSSSRPSSSSSSRPSSSSSSISSSSSFSSSSAYTFEEKMNIIKTRYANIQTSFTGGYFITPPSIVSPYAAGTVKPEVLQAGLNAVNLVRFIAGVPDDVVLDDGYTDLCQHGAVLLNINNVLSHYPTKPSDMPQDFYDKAYEATTHANISTNNLPTRGVELYMQDEDEDNYQIVGHRRWILNPAMKKTGFGVGLNRMGVMYSFDMSRSPAADYDYVAWPSPVAFPLAYVKYNTPWSITVNTQKYGSSFSGVAVTLKDIRRNIVYSSTAGNMYFNVNTDGAGVPNAIIFRPELSSSFNYQDGDEFEVTVTGLSEPLSYTVKFFSMP